MGGEVGKNLESLEEGNHNQSIQCEKKYIFNEKGVSHQATMAEN